MCSLTLRPSLPSFTLAPGVPGDRHVDVAASLSDLARVMRNTGRYKEAEEAYKEVLKVGSRITGPRKGY
jgi:hypothetical protein